MSTTKIEITDHYLVDFDCIFDTRLPIVSNVFGREIADLFVRTIPYFNRESDFMVDTIDEIRKYNRNKLKPGDLELVTKEYDWDLFKKAWDKRTKRDVLDVFQTSFFSNLLLSMIHFCTEVEAKATPYEGKVKLTINCCPYNLTEVEKEILKEVMNEHLLGMVEVNLINLGPELLTASYLNTFTDWVVYDLEHWLVVHQDKLVEYTQLKDLMVTTVGRWNKPTDSTVDESLESLCHTARQLCMPIFNLTHINPEFFCIDRDRILSFYD